MTYFDQGASPLMLEWWKPVVGFEDSYSVSNMGRVWNSRTSKSLSIYKNNAGYPNIGLWVGNRRSMKRIHQIVMQAFTGPRPISFEINHIDGCKSNNRVSNLEYCTKSANVQHAFRMSLMKPCPNGFKEGHSTNKRVNANIIAILRSCGSADQIKEAAKKYGFSMGHAYKLRSRHKS